MMEVGAVVRLAGRYQPEAADVSVQWTTKKGQTRALPASSVGRIAAVKANGLVLVRFLSQQSPARWFNPSNVELI